MLIYIAQLSHSNFGVNQNNTFPLAAGFIAAYLKEIFGSQVDIEVFKSVDDLSKAIDKKHPEILMLSNYLWNQNLNIHFANVTRRRYPDTLILMGGPNISVDNDERLKFYAENEYLDGYVLYEGEVVASEIVEAYLINPDRNFIRHMAHPRIVNDAFSGDLTNNSVVRIGSRDAEISLEQIPSPYLAGFFDKFFQDGELPLIETNRGCPFSCTFCQQGESYYAKVIHFDVDRIRKELIYIAQKISDDKVEIYGMEIADPNFGMYKRDKEICEILRGTQDKFGYPKSIGCSTGKNKADVIIENVDVLVPGSLILCSAMQSMNDATLGAVKRQNIKISAYRDIQNDMESKVLENTADLSLGLPLETKNTHMDGVFDLINIGVIEFSCLQTIVLKGTELDSQKYIQDYGIQRNFRLIPECEGVYDILGDEINVNEFEEIIIGTNTLTFDDYLECRKLHLLVMVYHNTRLLAIAYELFDRLGFQRSDIIRRLFVTKHQGLRGLMEDFIGDTKSELLGSTISDFNKFGQSAENKSHNVIFKHLSKCIFENKEIVLSALSDALMDLLGDEYEKEILEISEMLSLSIVDVRKDSTRNEYQIKSIELRRIFGPRIEFLHTKRQQSVLNVVKNMFDEPENNMAELAYRLRPSNIVLKHIAAEGPAEKASPLQDMHR